MYNVLRWPERVENPAARHALGILEEGRWARRQGLRPALLGALGAVVALATVRLLLFPRDLAGTRTLASPFAFSALFLLPIPLCFLSGFWSGWRGFGALSRDDRFRDIVLSTTRAELREGIEAGLAGRAIVAPVVLFQASFLILALDPQFQSGWFVSLNPAFLLVLMGIVFLVGAGPTLDYGLALGMRDRLAGRSAPAALASAAGHLAAAVASLVIGIGVFGLVFLNSRAEALKKEASRAFDDWLPSDDA